MSTATPEQRRSSRPTPQIRAVDVARVTKLSPNMVRVHFSGDDLDGFNIAGPAGHIKLFLPQPDQSEIDFEALAMPRGSRPPSAPISRTFTPRRFDKSTGELDVDFYIHGEGPASVFASTAAPGQRVAISGPSRPHVVKDDAWQLVAGDETALPAIAMILEALPSTSRGLVLLELGDVGDVPELPQLAGVEVQTLVRSPGEPAGTSMVNALRDAQFAGEPVQAYIAGESVAIRRARAVLLERGLSVSQLTTRGYWREGEAGHPDHDMGDD